MVFKPRRSDGGKPAPRPRDGAGSGDRDFRPSRSSDSRPSSSDRYRPNGDAPRRSEGSDSGSGYRSKPDDKFGDRRPRKTDGANNFDRDRDNRPRTPEVGSSYRPRPQGGSGFDRPKPGGKFDRNDKPREERKDWGVPRPSSPRDSAPRTDSYQPRRDDALSDRRGGASSFGGRDDRSRDDRGRGEQRNSEWERDVDADLRRVDIDRGRRSERQRNGAGPSRDIGIESHGDSAIWRCGEVGGQRGDVDTEGRTELLTNHCIAQRGPSGREVDRAPQAVGDGKQ